MNPKDVNCVPVENGRGKLDEEHSENGNLPESASFPKPFDKLVKPFGSPARCFLTVFNLLAHACRDDQRRIKDGRRRG